MRWARRTALCVAFLLAIAGCVFGNTAESTPQVTSEASLPTATASDPVSSPSGTALPSPSSAADEETPARPAGPTDLVLDGSCASSSSDDTCEFGAAITMHAPTAGVRADRDGLTGPDGLWDDMVVTVLVICPAGLDLDPDPMLRQDDARYQAKDVFYEGHWWGDGRFECPNGNRVHVHHFHPIDSRGVGTLQAPVRAEDNWGESLGTEFCAFALTGLRYWDREGGHVLRSESFTGVQCYHVDGTSIRRIVAPDAQQRNANFQLLMDETEEFAHMSSDGRAGLGGWACMKIGLHAASENLPEMLAWTMLPPKPATLGAAERRVLFDLVTRSGSLCDEHRFSTHRALVAFDEIDGYLSTLPDAHRYFLSDVGESYSFVSQHAGTPRSLTEVNDLESVLQAGLDLCAVMESLEADGAEPEEWALALASVADESDSWLSRFWWWLAGGAVMDQSLCPDFVEGYVAALGAIN